jgi:hypothetical protein
MQFVMKKSGQIQYIHVRYDKGEPSKDSSYNDKKFNVFVCEQTH